jgi:hypothetical protein
MVADAILIERTCRMLERRFGDAGRVPITIGYLENIATGFRDLAGHLPVLTPDGRDITELIMTRLRAEVSK